MNVGVIGAGKVGCALAMGFYNNGINVSGIVTRSDKSFEYICKKLSLNFNNNLVETVKKSDVVFLSVSDSQIESVAKKIVSEVEPSFINNKFFFHLSGALSSDELKCLKDLGAHTGSLHPIQTFAQKEDGWGKLHNIHYTFEGCKTSQDCANTIVKLFNGTIMTIKKEDKTLYHVAACIISNYTVTLSYIASEILTKIGIEKEDCQNAFIPLVKNTINNLEQYGNVGSLTGPIERGDDKIICQHIKNLGNMDLKLLDIYKLLGQKTIEVAKKKGTLTKNEENKIINILS
ncbi:UNVERIFIED_CONTAM: putative short-subunit dehydrogenase-like oxidoreductase (DUF2520 family) [Acetivibrio alkalicellulosi]